MTIRHLLCCTLAAQAVALAARPLCAQERVYSGTASNLGYPNSLGGGTTGTFELRLRGAAPMHGSLTVGAPLGGSGSAVTAVWADTVIVRSISEAGDTIVWLAQLRADSLRGPYLIVGGASAGQGGRWSAVRASGPRIGPAWRAARPFPDSVSMAVAFGSFTYGPSGSPGAWTMNDLIPPSAPPFRPRPEDAEDRLLAALRHQQGAEWRWVRPLEWAILLFVAVALVAMGRDLRFIWSDQRVLLAGAFVPGLYLVLAVSILLDVGVAALVIYLLFRLAMLVHRVPVGILALIGFGALMGLVALAQGAIASVRRAKVYVHGVPLDRAAAGPLFDLVHQLCERMGCAPPHSVVLEMGPSFFVTEARVETFNGRAHGRTLCVSAPLMRLLSVREFTGVVAHEMAHFTGSDTAFSRHFYPVYRGTTVAIGGLASIMNAKGDSAIWLSVALFLPLMLLNAYLGVFARIERGIGRQRELRADSLAAGQTSPAAMGSALAKVHAYAPQWSGAGDAIRQAATEDLVFTNLSRHFADWAAGEQALVPAVVSETAVQVTHPTDTHPPLSVRLANLGLPADRAPDLEPFGGAADLIPGLDPLEEDLTKGVTSIVLEQSRALGLPAPARGGSGMPPVPEAPAAEAPGAGGEPEADELAGPAPASAVMGYAGERPVAVCPRCGWESYNAMAETCPECRIPLRKL